VVGVCDSLRVVLKMMVFWGGGRLMGRREGGEMMSVGKRLRCDEMMVLVMKNKVAWLGW
jgi:hypothetical protein